MARYFFDSGDRDELVKDEVGIECDGIEGACREGIEGLKDLAREFQEGVQSQQLSIHVRDEAGERLLSLSLTLQLKLSRQRG
ncbi:MULTISPECIES: DUF6894 family protein [unclassified Mesorhizobium]|uniref:DUF6894 family protein n=1 Tax=Mesorhizobium sp. B2-1-1 TaxID=2589974 RepID=UPI001129DD43|nr:hypothetical protein FJ551_09205 [Mesorhizobium sp. B2-5-1]TPM60646.1 hypothetical protein FJ962_16060 [Mesorhizobium sp. B2-1-9]TPM88023.1 hypothetical protein FJ963_03485 [Mesorhizobium sp. B2-1-4]TPN11057.1 hypothetical protein FJ971_13225 [Mesorhizobium sp. B2-1-2]